MGDYDDYSMNAPETNKVAAGICHNRGVNAKLPPQWLIYITVKNVEESINNCEKMGGKNISGIKKTGGGKYCVIQDPAGAFCALFSPEE
jgi:predicted enzyme related to lactoylglutathione lyase